MNQIQKLESCKPTTVIATDLAGRRVATFTTKGEFYAKETFFHHPPEVSGPGFAGGPIVRDRNAALVDPDEWSQPADPDRLERRYYATDWQGRVVSLVTAAGEQAESYRYTANGVPIGIPLGDVNGDGKVEVGASEEDWQQAYWWENNYGPYEARLDLNLDGSVNATDIGLVGSQTPGTMPTARASAASVGNRMFASARVDREAVLGREGDYRLFEAVAMCVVYAHAEDLPSGDELPSCGRPKLLGQGTDDSLITPYKGLQESVGNNKFRYAQMTIERKQRFSDAGIEVTLNIDMSYREETSVLTAR
jgi:hypothetical protein